MTDSMRCLRIAALVALLLVLDGVADAADPSRLQPPVRPLPQASLRPAAAGPGFYVDATDGDDAHDGSRDKPWKTIAHAVRQLQPGDTLYLCGGVFYEHVVVPTSGSEEKPITIRSAPGELAFIDGSLCEFFEQPASAWNPLKEGEGDEYVSAKTYPQFARRPILNVFAPNAWEPFHGIEDQRPVVLGNFAESMIPLHGYRTLADLRDDSMLWDIDNKVSTTTSMYCGPGLWFNPATERIHIRLAHTTLAGLGDHAYRGETDPRKLPLIISGPYGEDVLRLNDVQHLVVQDVVLRGASGSPLVNIYGSANIAFEGVTFYGGSPSLLINATQGLRLTNCAVRSLAAPWSSRASMKYRGTPSYAIITQRNQPLNQDFEFAYCEFTDGHDFAWLRDVKNLRFHHNLVDNFNDDGIEVGAKKRDQELYIYQNLVSRCLINFTLHEIEPDESPATVNPGSGVFITRNIVDLRQGTFKGPPREPDPSGSYLNQIGMLASDHGGPDWPHYHFYHNTVVQLDPSFRNYYGFGMGGQGLRRTERRVYNNIFVQLTGMPGLNMVPNAGLVEVDGNLHWSLEMGPGFEGDFFQQQGKTAFRNQGRGTGWMEHDLFADPRFAQLAADPRAAFNLTLQEGSPAINAGVKLPEAWFDPLRGEDAGQADLGAFPAQVEPWPIGIGGRIKLAP